MKKGIDISQWQGDIDFAKVTKEVDFVILREGYRQSTDSKFFEYVQGCRENNILIHGIYHFLYPLNNQDVLAEAKSCIANFKAANLDPFTVRIWCDLEYDTIENARKQGVVLGKKEINVFTKTFCDYLVSLINFSVNSSEKKEAGIFSMPYYWHTGDEQTFIGKID